MNEQLTPWYKQFWPWFILTPLLFVFVAGFAMLFLSIKTYDGVVVENYDKDGKSIIARHDQDQYAQSLNLNALLRQNESSLTLQLNGKIQRMPEVLRLHIIYPTSKAFDIIVPMNHQGLGRYHAKLPEVIEGKRSLNLQPDTKESTWRILASDVVFPINSEAALAPKFK